MIARPRRHLLPLFIVAILILAAGIWLARSRDTEPSAAVGTKVLPTLSDKPGKLNDVNEVRIFKAGEQPLVTLKRTGGADKKDSWTVVERSGYPADIGKVRELLMKLSELEIVEEKTSNPESYPALGVEDLKSDKATGKRIDLKGIDPPPSLIVGKNGPNYSSTYVRLAGQAKSVLAKPQLTIHDEAPMWLNRSVLDLKEEDVQAVRVNNVGKTNYTVTREARDQKDFTVPNLPKGRKLTSPGAPSTNASSLANLDFEDVRPLGKDEDWSKDGRAVFHYFDGTVVTVTGRESDDKHWMRFEVSFDEAQHRKFKPAAKPGEKKEETDKPGSNVPQIVEKNKDMPPSARSPDEVRSGAEKLNTRLKDWVYEIQGYRYDNILRPLDDLLEKPEEKKK